MTDPRWRSPLSHRAPVVAGDNAQFAEVPFLGVAILRGERDDVGAAAASALGVDLPAGAGETATGPNASVMWLAPDEWLIVAPDGIGSVAQALERALDGMHHQCIDVSDYYTAIDVGGARARDLLSKLMVIDLHPRALAVGRGVATTLAKAQIWCWLRADREGGPPVFRIFIRRSMAEYVWDLLVKAGREWGVASRGEGRRMNEKAE